VTASNLKQTPLNQWHRDHGAKMVDFGGWDMPVQYETGILQEHLATRKFGGLFDVSHMGRFRFKGANRISFLQHVLSNNAEALEPWQAQYTLVPNENGGLVDDAYLYRFGEDDYLLVVNASNAEKDWGHFQHQARNFPGLVMENHSEKLAMIAFQGPLAGQILEELIEAGALPKPFRNSLSEVTIAGANMLIGRTGYTA
jgi:aminomethyltransferase